jgi:hypothetical protein
MRWIEIKGQDNKIVNVNLDNVLATLIMEGEITTKPKSEIVGSKATIEKRWIVNLVMEKDLAFVKMFNILSEAEKWQKDYILNA